MSNAAESWQKGQPITLRLPGENSGYRKDEEWEEYDPTVDPPIARWLQAPWDTLLMDTKAKLDGFPDNYLYPETAYTEALDWLAQFCGYTGDYWSSDWPVAAKRQLLISSYSFVWTNKGSRRLLEWVIKVFELQVQVYLLGEFLASRSRVPAPLGGEPFLYYLLVRLNYLRTSNEWALIEQLNRLFGPVYAESRICYDQFYAGFSVCGDPVFAGRSQLYGFLLTEEGWRLLTENDANLEIDFNIRAVRTEDGGLLLSEDGSILELEAVAYLELLQENGDRILADDYRGVIHELTVLLQEDGYPILLETGSDYIRLDEAS